MRPADEQSQPRQRAPAPHKGARLVNAVALSSRAQQESGAAAIQRASLGQRLWFGLVPHRDVLPDMSPSRTGDQSPSVA
jgi:hypothetical protein